MKPTSTSYSTPSSTSSGGYGYGGSSNSTGNYGYPSLPQATGTGGALGGPGYNPNSTSNLKPIRNFFKVASQGVYKIAEEITFNAPTSKVTQRKMFHPLAATKISFVATSNTSADGKEDDGWYFVFNIAECMPMYYLKDSRTAAAKDKTPLSFREMPTCHSFNKVTCSPVKLELLVGFASGDILLYEPLSKTSSIQFNKEKSLVSGKVTGVQWVPGSKNEFVVSFSTGIMLFMDRDREDQPPQGNGSGTGGVLPNSKPETTDSFCVVRQKNAKFNPVSKWMISSKSINGFAFSPSGKHIAVASQDGYLRVFDCEEETMLVAFRSYYGGFLCVTWSPDGKYIATGGEDDLVCVWSLLERCILARGQGHRSFVTEVKFDPWACGVGPNNSTYRIASVGEDTRLLLWDFERELLRRPRNISMSFSSRKLADLKLSLSHVQSQTQQPNHNHNSHAIDQYKAPIVESLGRNEVPQMHPLVEHRTHHEPVSDVYFLENFIVTCSWGKVKFWSRPEALATNGTSDHVPSHPPISTHSHPTTSSTAVPIASAPTTTTSTTPLSSTPSSLRSTTPTTSTPPPLSGLGRNTTTTTAPTMPPLSNSTQHP